MEGIDYKDKYGVQMEFRDRPQSRLVLSVRIGTHRVGLGLGLGLGLQWICRQMGIRAVFKSSGTLRGSLMKVKEPRPPLLKKGVVYRVPCLDCNSSHTLERQGGI